MPQDAKLGERCGVPPLHRALDARIWTYRRQEEAPSLRKA